MGRIKETNRHLAEVNVTQLASIQSLEATTAATSETLSELASSQEKQLANYKVISRQLTQLRRDNVKVKEYLDAFVPPNVGQLLNSARTNKPSSPSSSKQPNADSPGTKGSENLNQ